MDAVVEEIVVVPELDSLRPSPEQRTNVVLRLLEEVVTIDVEENNHDLQLFFLDFAPPVLADLHRHIPALATMEKTMAHGSLVLGLAASTGSTRSAAQQQRVEDAIRAKGPEFLRALGRYRIDPAPLVEETMTSIWPFLTIFSTGIRYFSTPSSTVQLCAKWLTDI